MSFRRNTEATSLPEQKIAALKSERAALLASVFPGESLQQAIEPQAMTPSPAPAPFVELVAQRGYVLALPSGQTHVRFGELAHLIADALWPEAGADDTRMS